MSGWNRGWDARSWRHNDQGWSDSDWTGSASSSWWTSTDTSWRGSSWLGPADGWPEGSWLDGHGVVRTPATEPGRRLQQAHHEGEARRGCAAWERLAAVPIKVVCTISQHCVGLPVLRRNEIFEDLKVEPLVQHAVRSLENHGVDGRLRQSLRLIL